MRITHGLGRLMKNMILLRMVVFLAIASSGCASPDRSRGATPATRSAVSGTFQDFIATQGTSVPLRPGANALAAKSTSPQVFDNFRKWCKQKGGTAGTSGNGMYPSWFCKGGEVENGLVGVFTQGADYFSDPPRVTVYFYAAHQIDPALANAMVTEAQLAARRQAQNDTALAKRAAKQETLPAKRTLNEREAGDIARAQKIQKGRDDLEAVRLSRTQFWGATRRGDKACLTVNPAKFETNDLGGGMVSNVGVATYLGTTLVSAYVEELAGDNVKLTLGGFRFVGKLAYTENVPDREFRPDHIATPDGMWKTGSVIWQPTRDWGRCPG